MPQIQLIRKNDALKSGQWWLWECLYEKDGVELTGFIEGDNYDNYALETLEDENGERIKL